MSKKTVYYVSYLREDEPPPAILNDPLLRALWKLMGGEEAPIKIGHNHVYKTLKLGTQKIKQLRQDKLCSEIELTAVEVDSERD